MVQTLSPTAVWATALIDGLARAGAGWAVISPGSRSTPLALAALRHPMMRTRVVLDERAAAFFALGLARAEGRPPVLICTSGSAVANWHPAVAEADAARLPLILLSADRPPELQDCGANQTIDQRFLFGPQVRAVHTLPPAEPETGWLAALAARVVSQSLWPLAGPVQVNVPLREPLVPAALVPDPARPPPRVVLPRLEVPAAALDDLARRIEGRRGVIVAGAEPQPAAALAGLARALGWPILADPLSGLRHGAHPLTHVVAHAGLIVRGTVPAAECVLRFGAQPVSKTVGQWLAAAADHLVVSPDSRWPDPGRDAAVMIHADPAALATGLAAAVGRRAPDGWLDGWRAADRRAGARVAAHGPAEAGVVRAAIAALPSDGLLFVANSMAIRDVDDYSGVSSRTVTVMGNRGVSGIDGTLATFFGALASGRFAAGIALVGDLAFLHDVGGLAVGQGQRGVICVLDNGGGMIFDHLPQAALPEFEAGWLTPQRADLAAAARVWGHDYRAVPPAAAAVSLADAMAGPGVGVLHLAIDRARSVADHRALWAVSAEETFA